MKVDKLIQSVFPTEETLNIPTGKETDKLIKTWKGVITDLEENYGPETKKVKADLEKIKKEEERITHETIALQRKKNENESKLKQSQEADKKTLEKIIGKYRGDKLAEQISRLNELPIESFLLVSQEDKPSEGSTSDPRENTPNTGITYSVHASDLYTMVDDGWTKKKKTKKLPYLVIFTKSLKTSVPEDEELKPFNLLDRIKVKSWGDKDIGRFMIIMNLDKMSRQDGGLRTFNIEKMTDEVYDHACINNGTVCLGNLAGVYDKLSKNYQIYDMVELLFDHLKSVTTAKPVSNPYCEWDKWFARVKPVSPKFTKKRITDFFNKKDNLTFGYDFAQLTDNATPWMSTQLTTATSTYGSLSPSYLPQRDSAIGPEAEREMQRHLQNLSRQLDQYRQQEQTDFTRLGASDIRPMAIDPMRTPPVYGHGGGGGNTGIAVGGGGGMGLNSAGQSPSASQSPSTSINQQPVPPRPLSDFVRPSEVMNGI